MMKMLKKCLYDAMDFYATYYPYIAAKYLH